MFVSYTTPLNLVARMCTSRGFAAIAWLIGGGIAMGTGILIHAFHHHGSLHAADPDVVSRADDAAVVLLIAIATSAFALTIASGSSIGIRRLTLGAQSSWAAE